MNKGINEISIGGAGPAGMAAGIILAKAGYRVKIFEQRSAVGSRFNDDFQGLENWSRDEDVLDELIKAGIEPTWWSRPFNGGTLFDPKLRPIEIRSERPLFYMLRRGNQHPKSLDLALYKQAKEAGVDFVFNKRIDKKKVDIIAGGPRGNPQVVAAGITFDTDLEDFACGILHEDLAPSGYVYFLISEGQATLATVLFKNLKDVHQCMQNTIGAIKQLYNLDTFDNVREWGGYGTFGIPKSCENNGTLSIGEAAGFQDFLFGFGIRYAMISGTLAAQSILEERSFDELWRARLLPHLKASLVNRVVYDKLGNFAKSGFWHLTGKNNNPDRFMKWLYGLSPLHKIMYPFLSKIFKNSLV